jgi:Glycosyltransferase sugar-binding region containing DXD motif
MIVVLLSQLRNVVSRLLAIIRVGYQQQRWHRPHANTNQQQHDRPPPTRPPPPRDRRVVIVSAAVVGGVAFLLLCCYVPLHIYLFGYGATRRGGTLGRFMDNAFRRSLFQRAALQYEDRFRAALGYPLPEVREDVNRVGVHVLTQTRLAETLLRAIENRRFAKWQHQQEKPLTVTTTKAMLGENPPSTNSSSKETDDTAKNGPGMNDHRRGCSCRNRLFIFQVNQGDWYRPVGWDRADFGMTTNRSTDAAGSGSGRLQFPSSSSPCWDGTSGTRSSTNGEPLEMIVIDSDQVQEFRMDHKYAADHDSAFFARASVNDQVQMFALYALYEYGGIFVEPNITNNVELFRTAPQLSDWLQSVDGTTPSDTLKNPTSTTASCQPALFVQSSVRSSSSSAEGGGGSRDVSISVLAATPKHPKLLCVMHELMAMNDGASTKKRWGTVFRLLSNPVSRWDPTCEPRCCPLQNLPPDEEDSEHGTNSNNNNDMYADPIQLPTASTEDGPRFRMISVTEASGTNVQPKVFKTSKDRCSVRLEKAWCSAGWLCNRCLRLPFLGSLHACRWVCRSCYTRTVCQAPRTGPPKRDVVVQAMISEIRFSTQKRIPRIIHQTWMEELTTARYPHYQRLQNSWRAAPGWEYRFYTDDDCVAYIQQRYPQRFVDAYNAILPGAFKADVFRLLVLFFDGGIYADVDVMLQADLEYFITKDLAFFVPRDVPLDYWPNSNYCLWNGLMGAQPGNPIIGRAIEDVITNILNRVDYYDVEGALCSAKLTAEVWKLRTLPILILTGPCALGMSVNKALGNVNVLQGHDLGWLRYNTSEREAYPSPSGNWGHALTLLADRYDLGELRFTDLDRNLLIASSNQDRIAKGAIHIGDQSKTNSIHYSKSETDIVGEYATYNDDKVTNERIRIEILHQYR